MQPSPAVLQLSPWKEPCVNPRLKEICADLFPTPVELDGTWRTFSYHLASGVFPELFSQFVLQTDLENRADIFFFFFFFFTPLFEVQIYERSFLELIFYSWYQELYHISFWCLTLNYM